MNLLALRPWSESTRFYVDLKRRPLIPWQLFTKAFNKQHQVCTVSCVIQWSSLINTSNTQMQPVYRHCHPKARCHVYEKTLGSLICVQARSADSLWNTRRRPWEQKRKKRICGFGEDIISTSCQFIHSFFWFVSFRRSHVTLPNSATLLRTKVPTGKDDQQRFVLVFVL